MLSKCAATILLSKKVNAQNPDFVHTTLGHIMESETGPPAFFFGSENRPPECYFRIVQVHSAPLMAAVVVYTKCPLLSETLVVPTKPDAPLIMGKHPSGNKIMACCWLMALRSSVSGISANDDLY